MTNRLFPAILVAILSVVWAGQATSQGLFRPVAEVGTKIVTGYEVQQKMRILELQGGSGNLREMALEELISERLQDIATERAGIVTSDAALDDAIAEIAARTNRTAAEFLADLARDGVDPDVFKATTRTGVAWRQLVRARFGPQVDVTEAEIDRALGVSGARGGLEMRFAEIFLPTNTANNAAVTADLAPQIQAVTDYEVFSDAARRFSIGPSGPNGGIIPEWVNISDIPPALRGQLLNMRPGDVTEPIDFGNAVGLFQLRGTREARAPSQGASQLDFITYTTTPADASRLRDFIDTCTDYYGEVKGAARDRLTRQTLSSGAVPQHLAIELARLDPGETSLALSADGGASVTMVTLCSRVAGARGTGEDAQEEARAQVRADLTNRKLTAYSEALLEEIRGDTKITRK